MATYTPNNNFKKPDGQDYVRVSDLNGNMDIADAKLGNLAQLETPEKQSLVAAINNAAQMGGGHPPHFNEDTATWWEWDQATLQYVDTGVPASATIEVDSTETLPPGSDATVENVGTALAVKLKFGIPEGEQGIQGDTGPRGETGAGLALLGHFDTLAELEAAHPIGNPGDMYSVGTETPRDIYQWSEITGAWVNEGPMGGGSGTVKSVNAVDPDEDGNIALTAADIPMAGEGSGSVGDTLTATGPGQVLASTETEPGVYAARMRALELDDLLLPGAGPHNSIYRGKYLGDAPTAAQYAAIADGTFDDLYIGDYWTIGGVNYRIAGFDYYYNVGNAALTTHHVVIVPSAAMDNAAMNGPNTTEGGYAGSQMRASGLNNVKATINAAFPGHILNHQQYLVNAVTNGKPSGVAAFDCTVELLSEIMLYGSGIYSPVSDGTTIPANGTFAKGQLPLFAMRHDLIGCRQNYWTRDVVSGTHYGLVQFSGYAYYNGAAAAAHSIRPVFAIIG